MKRFFVCALLVHLLQNHTFLLSETRNHSHRFDLSACHSMRGSLQFPSSLQTLPKFPLYSSGKKLTTEVDPSKNSIHYTTPKGSYQDDFHLVIASSIDFEMVDNEDDSNTVAYLKIPKEQKYKYFYTYLAPIESNEKNKDIQGNAPFEWIIEERALPESGRIPDNAIIIVCNPEFIESIQPGSYRDLPLIKMRTDLVQFAGSEAKIHDHLNEILLASIDIDTIHTTARQEHCIKISQNKVLIPALTT